MGDVSDRRQAPTSQPMRILMICPACGHENQESASRLRGRAYACSGDGCDYQFELGDGSAKGLAEGLSAMWRRFYAALTPAD